MAAADWPQHLPWVLLDINNAPKEDTGKSAAQMVYGTSLTLPAQMAARYELPVDKILRNLSSAAPIPTRYGQKEAPTEPPGALASADLVYVRKGGQLQPLPKPYSGPYKVLERGPKYFRLDIGGKDTAVTVDRLKPHTGAAAKAAASYTSDDNGYDNPSLTSHASNANGSDYSSPGTITWTSSH